MVCQHKKTETTNAHRLPLDVFPVHYNLTLTPNLEDWTYSGYETIDLNVSNETSHIVLNATALEITEAVLNDSEPCVVEYDNEMEKITIPLSYNLSPGKAKLYLKFKGTLNNDMRGFYRSTYKTDDGEEIRLGVTQFEASDARRAFPCWDEPNIKATFDVNLIVPKTKVALSNMPEKCRAAVSEDLVRVEYERSPIMSTYLLAFVIGEMDYIESFDSNGVKIRVYTAKGKSDRGRFALDVCCKTLPFYATYFGIAYPLPKMDLVAIPDFAAGAMENWGLVTYREVTLLVDEKESSAMSKQTVALVVGHECAHMWFGNLVTMDWWTDLWLNEGFATFTEYLCVDHCYPEFDIWTAFASDEYARALGLDSLQSSHPIQVTVHKPSEIGEIFDAISYAKGACLIRMLNDYLTNDVFRRGLRLYLQRHKYRNAETVDLWNALAETSGLPVATMMDSWTKQMGFPVVSVDQVRDHHGNTTAVTLTQRRFVSCQESSDGCSSSSGEQFWIVPVTVCSMHDSNNVLLRVVMEQHGQPQTFVLPEPELGSVKINPGAIGFYHVRYEEATLPALISALSEDKLGACDRFSIVLDQYALARYGFIASTCALDVARSFKVETNFTVWVALLADVRRILALVNEMEPSLSPNTRRFLIKLTEPIYRKLGWRASAEESHNDTMLRPMIIAVLGQCGFPEVLDESRKRFNNHYESSSVNGEYALPADIRSAVYATVLRHGDSKCLDQMIDLLSRTDLQEERMRIMGSLGSVPLPLLSQVHRFALSDNVRKQDKCRVLLSTVTGAASRSLFWDFLRTEWDEFRRQMTSNIGGMLGAIIKGAFKDFVTIDRHNEIQTFFAEHPCDVRRPIEQTLENIKINSAQLARDGASLKNFFNEY